ncbi:helix-turn-helix transcriptional regulator [Ralstonia sp. A12]|uniref:helix-turn-helix transcriptional regulator n=1 Tax=Ralstonia sp. A12 TaxID=1217052 RepID=UPI000694F64E|nr:LuxR C-terminal-related transcriptional regulator [Ralstonia sp. A12]
MALSTHEIRALLKVVARLQELSTESLVHRHDLVTELCSLLHADVVGHLVWRDGGRMLEEPGGWGREDHMAAEYRQHFQTVDPISPLLRGRPDPVVIESLVDRSTLQRTEYFSDFLRRYQTNPGISMYFEDGSDLLLDYRFGTSDAKKRFGSREQTLLDLLQPYLVNAHRLRQVARAQRQAVSSGSPSFLLESGRPPQPNRKARALLACLEMDERDSLVDMLYRVDAGTSANTEWNGFALCTERERDVLSGQPRCTVHLLARSVGSAAWFLQQFDVTLREGEVCHLMLQGMSDKQIALTLKISYWTVRIYVSRILDKLGIESRSALGLAVLRASQKDTAILPDRCDSQHCVADNS